MRRTSCKGVQMAKLKRKYTKPSPYIGVVGGTQIRAEGRTKREAVKRLRRAFLNQGIQTIPDGHWDLLEVFPASRDGVFVPTVKAPKVKSNRSARRKQPEFI